MRAALLLVLAATLALEATASGASVRWRVVDLGTLGGSNSAAAAVNERGQVVGTSQAKDGSTHAFLWQNGRMLDLGDTSVVGAPVAINDRGQVLLARQRWEHVALADELVASEAFLWEAGRRTRIPPVAGREIVEPRALNAAGQVVGVSRKKDGGAEGFVWSAGRTTDLAAVGTPQAIDERGRVLGSGKSSPFLWQAGRTTSLPQGCAIVEGAGVHGIVLQSSSGGSPAGCTFVRRDDTRTFLRLPGIDPVPVAGNARGWIFGWAFARKATPRKFHYVLWRNGRATDFGAFDNAWAVPSMIFQMNDTGLLVWSVDDYKRQQVFAWESGRTTTLPTLGGKRVYATALNDRRQVVGVAQVANGRKTHAVLWAPAS